MKDLISCSIFSFSIQSNSSHRQGQAPIPLGKIEITPGKKVYASIRPEDVEIFTEPPQDKENLFKGTIAHKAYLGNFLYFFVNVNGNMIRVQVSHILPQEEGEELYLYLNPDKCVILF